MRWLIDVVYLLAAVVSSPVWLLRLIRTGRIRTDWAGRFGYAGALQVKPGRPRVLLQAVSVGEINTLRLLVPRLAELPERPEIIVASTTDTGFARAETLFGEEHDVVRYPLDFTFAVRRFLDSVRPTVAILVELEVWPNFTALARRRGIPIGLINGRLSDRSMRGYRLLGPEIRASYRRMAWVAAQNETYARRFRAMGVNANSVEVTGTMKWDSVPITDTVEGADALAEAMGIDRRRHLVVAGSTAPGEHELIRSCIPPGTQLLCAPRRNEWFDQAAQAMPGCARRSKGTRGDGSGLFLLDTIGELRHAYALADVVVVGRTFGRLHGSDMMEPIALGKPTIVGPAVSDFTDTVEALLDGGGLVQTTPERLADVLATLLASPERRRELVDRGRAVIRAQQGATEHHTRMIQALLEKRRSAHAVVAAPGIAPG